MFPVITRTGTKRRWYHDEPEQGRPDPDSEVLGWVQGGASKVMDPAKVREKLQIMGIQYTQDSGYPDESEIPKVAALYELVEAWVVHEVGAKNLDFNPGLAGPADDFLKDWVQESMEEFLFG